MVSADEGPSTRYSVTGPVAPLHVRPNTELPAKYVSDPKEGFIVNVGTAFASANVAAAIRTLENCIARIAQETASGRLIVPLIVYI